MNKNNIKNLARLTIKEEKIDRNLSRMVLTRLSRKELRDYFNYLKTLSSQNTIRVLSKGDLGGNLKKQIEKKFHGKNIIFAINESIGDGIRVEIHDSVIDLTFKGIIDRTLDNLRS